LTGSACSARNYALKLLSYRGRSERELKERLLRKGFSEEEIAEAFSLLRKAGLLSDKSLAGDLKRQAFEGKLLGHRGARALMEKRGLSGETIDEVLDYDEERELTNAQKLMDKKVAHMGNYYLTEAEKKRLWQFLARRGYSCDVIRRTMRNLKLDEEGRS
jgi:regulatory protein